MRMVKNNLPKIQKALDQLKRKEVLVGIPSEFADSTQHPEINNATLGYLHEHGSASGSLPARPFVGPGVEKSKHEWQPMLQKAVENTLKGEDQKALNAMTAAGIAAQNAIKRYIKTNGDGTWPKRNEYYDAKQRAKGKTTTLINSGSLEGSIHYVIRNGSN